MVNYGVPYNYYGGGLDTTFIIFILALAGAIVIYFTFLSSKNDKKFTGFTGYLFDFLSFKKLFLEDILKIMYLFCALFITVLSLYLISIDFVSFLVTLILGNILVRVAYEGIILLIMLYKNVVEINNKLKK